jgi:hypothetical protein
MGKLSDSVAFDFRTVTIAASASVSGEFDLEAYKLVGIIMPSAWTAANLTFQAAPVSGGTFADMYDDAGDEVTVTAAASRAIGADYIAGALAAFRVLKIRSGTSATPVTQAAERTITLVLKQ